VSGDDIPGAAFADLRAEVARAFAAPEGKTSGTDRGVTSDLSIDEALLLHSIGWEPIDLIFGASVVSIPVGIWTWGQGALDPASSAHAMAMTSASRRMEDQCASVGGHGAVGVRVAIEIHPRHVDVELTGTAVRPVGRAARRQRPFVSDLSARDFALLQGSGWAPVGLAFGASFVYAPRRTAGTVLRQSTQNVELVNYTQALYAARESAMERMQRSALEMSAHGIVAVRVDEGPMPFARHVIRFSSWGTAVALVAESHVGRQPRVVLALDDQVVQFAPEALHGG